MNFGKDKKAVLLDKRLLRLALLCLTLCDPKTYPSSHNLGIREDKVQGSLNSEPGRKQ